jgi:hypothetical protein
VAALFARLFGRIVGKRRAHGVTVAGIVLYVPSTRTFTALGPRGCASNSEHERPDGFYVDNNARNRTNSAILQKSTLCRTQNPSGLWPDLELLEAAPGQLTPGAGLGIIGGG